MKRMASGMKGFTLCLAMLLAGGCATTGARPVNGGPDENTADANKNKGKNNGKYNNNIAAIALDKITLVESIPLETEAVLDRPEIANAATLWPELVNKAQSSIDWAMFYASEKEGAALTPVVEGLIAAAKRGVKVRIVADAGFTKTYPETLNRFESNGITVKRWDIKSVTKGVMHAKYFIIDKQIVFLGSQNFDYRSLEHVYETGIMVDNQEFAARVTQIFEQDLEMAADPALKLPKVYCPRAEWLDETKTQIELTATPPRFQTNTALCEKQELVSIIGKAKESVNLQVLQYSPVNHNGKDYFGDLDEALRRAAGRGVKVQIIVSDWSTKKPAIDWIKSLSLIPNITVKIITIPQHSQGFIDHSRVAHSKYLTIDNRWSWIGSSNWEKNYFTASRNVGALIRSIPFTKQVIAMFNNVWNSEYCHDIDVTKDYIVPKRTED